MDNMSMILKKAAISAVSVTVGICAIVIGLHTMPAGANASQVVVKRDSLMKGAVTNHSRLPASVDDGSGTGSPSAAECPELVKRADAAPAGRLPANAPSVRH